jgi:acyl CoA:acetate/3-ketoacid CoA transferase alpha subunit
MKVHQITEAAPVIWGAVWIMRMLAAGAKGLAKMPAARTYGEKTLQTMKEVVFKGKRMYASPKQAQKLEGLSKEASDLRNTILRLKGKNEKPEAAFQARRRLYEVKEEMQAVLKEVAKNRKRDMKMY